MTLRINRVCGKCGSDRIWCNTMAIWNLAKECWEIEEVYEDEGWCRACEASCEVKTEEVNTVM